MHTDVLKAMEELDFEDFLPRVQYILQAHRDNAAAKRKEYRMKSKGKEGTVAKANPMGGADGKKKLGQNSSAATSVTGDDEEEDYTLMDGDEDEELSNVSADEEPELTAGQETPSSLKRQLSPSPDSSKRIRQ